MRHVGTDNLIPFNKMDKDRHRELSSKGGKNSHKRQAERKRLREWAEALGTEEIELSDGSEMARNGVVILQLYNAAIRGDVKAARFLADILGETSAAQILNQQPADTNIILKID